MLMMAVRGGAAFVPRRIVDGGKLVVLWGSPQPLGDAYGDDCDDPGDAVQNIPEPCAADDDDDDDDDDGDDRGAVQNAPESVPR